MTEPRDAGGPEFSTQMLAFLPRTPPQSAVHQVWLLDYGARTGGCREAPSLGNPAPLSPGLATPRHGGPRLPGRGLAPGGPLTQQWLPRGLLCWLLAAGPEVALGVPDLEAGLLPDGAGRGTWGEPKSPQVWPLLWEGRWRGLWRECPSVRGCRGHKATGNWGGGTSSASFFSL